MFDWNTSYAIGVPELDQQHQRLIEFYGVIAETTDSARVSELLTDLGDYLHYHFEVEERFMRERGFDGLAEHAREHRDVIGALDVLSKRVLAQPECQHEVAKFLKEWVARHILVIDRELAALAGDAAGST